MMRSSTAILYKPRAYMGITLWTLFIIPVWIEALLRFLNLHLDKFPDFFNFVSHSQILPFGTIALLIVFVFLAWEIYMDFYSAPSKCAIQITERGVSGPERQKKEKGRPKYDIIQIPFDEIDWEQSFQDAKLGYSYIYAKDGRVIFLHPRLGPTQIAEIEDECKTHQ